MSTHQIDFLPYGRQTITDDDISAVVDVLRSRYLTQGPVVEAFERSVAQKVGASHAVAVNSAARLSRSIWALVIVYGLHRSLSSLQIVRYCSAEVDFVDIDPNTGLMSIQALKAKLHHAEQIGLLPKVVVPVHLAGCSCDMAEIGSLSERYGFSVLEDASHAIGGRYQGHPVGNCRHSAITVFSFHPVKIITSGEGGLTSTNDPILAKRMGALSRHCSRSRTFSAE